MNPATDMVRICVRSGRGTLEIHNQKYELTAGDAFLLCPDVEAWYEADWEDPWSYMWVGFTGYRAQEYAGHAGFTKRTPIRKVNCGKELNSYIDGILEAHQLSYTDELKRNGYLMLFFATLMEDYKKIVPAIVNQHSYPGSVYVKHAMDYIAHHYREKIKISELADYIGSTTGIINYAGETDAQEMIICTESGVLYELEKRYPEKKFYFTETLPVCRNMKKVTLEKILHVLKTGENEVFVDDALREESKKPLERMLELAK